MTFFGCVLTVGGDTVPHPLLSYELSHVNIDIHITYRTEHVPQYSVQTEHNTTICCQSALCCLIAGLGRQQEQYSNTQPSIVEYNNNTDLALLHRPVN